VGDYIGPTEAVIPLSCGMRHHWIVTDANGSPYHLADLSARRSPTMLKRPARTCELPLRMVRARVAPRCQAEVGGPLVVETRASSGDGG
jgi:hypothetical protein